MTGIDQDFSARSGFVPRTGVVMTHAYNRFSWYGARGAPIEQFSIFGGTPQIWDYQQFLRHRPIEGDGDVSLSLRLRGGWNVNGSAADAFTRFDPATYASYTVRSGDVDTPFAAPSGIFGAWNESLTVATPLFQHYEASLGVSDGATPIFPEAARGNAIGVTASLTVRASSSVRAWEFPARHREPIRSGSIGSCRISPIRGRKSSLDMVRQWMATDLSPSAT
ncbi:MAG TPA: hypothetical protein VGL65_11420 [Gemmatimonadales bacterium]